MILQTKGKKANNSKWMHLYSRSGNLHSKREILEGIIHFIGSQHPLISPSKRRKSGKGKLDEETDMTQSFIKEMEGYQEQKWIQIEQHIEEQESK